LEDFKRLRVWKEAEDLVEPASCASPLVQPQSLNPCSCSRSD